MITLAWSSIARSPRGLRSPLGAVGLGLACIAVNDLLLAYFSAQRSFASGGAADLLWTGGFLAIAGGAAWDAANPQANHAPAGSDRRSLLTLLVPFTCSAVAVGFAVLDFATDRGLDPVTLAAVLVIMLIATILARRASTDSLTQLANRDA